MKMVGFSNFFVDYRASIIDFARMKKIIIVPETFLKRNYGGVLLSTIVQNAENYIFLSAICVVDFECDAFYKYFFENLRSFVLDTSELCIIFDTHQNIEKMLSIVLPFAHYGCCMRHL